MKIWSEKHPKTGKKRWCANFKIKGKRHEPKAPTRDELDDIIDAIKRRARQEKYGIEVEHATITLSELVDERVKDYDRKDRKHRQKIALLEKFRDEVGANTPVRKVTTAGVRAFVFALRRQTPTLKSSSVNTMLNAVNALLHKAGAYFPELESWKAPRMPFEEEGKRGRERLITEEEQAQLLFRLRAPRKAREKPEAMNVRHTVADLFDVALMTGMRNTEVRTLTKARIDWAVRTLDDFTVYGEIRLPSTRTKTKEPRRIPINRDVRQILERRQAEASSQWLFPNGTGSGPVHESVVRRILQREAKNAGLSYGRDDEDGFVFHDTRHTAATNMLERGAHLKTVGAILGHTDETMTLRYSHDTWQSRSRAVLSLERGEKESEKEKSQAPGKKI